MLVSNMTVHNMHATVLACTHSNSLHSVLGLGYSHIGTKVNTAAAHALQPASRKNRCGLDVGL